MDSVIFEDVSALQGIKKAKRKQMLSLMLADQDWHKKDSSVTREIMRLGREINSGTIDTEKPIKSIDINKFTQTDYLQLKELGYSDAYIASLLGITRGRWRNYKKELLSTQC